MEEARWTILPVDRTNLDAAAEVHAVSWRASHTGFCAPEFTAAHTTERQRAYLRRKTDGGSRLFLLYAPEPVGLVSVTGCLIEDLYVLPDRQGRGYGTALLRHAIQECKGTPRLWILENNPRAARLYARVGFRPTGRINRDHGLLAEIEYALPDTRREEGLMETERLLVRRLTEADAEALHAVLSDPEVMRYLEPPFTMERTKAFIREAGLCEPLLVYAVIWKGPVPLKPEGPRQSAAPTLIGHLIWHPWDETAMELGWILRRDYWGRGIAGELTAAMLARTDRDIVIECSPEQIATRKIAETFGFKPAPSGGELLAFRRTTGRIPPMGQEQTNED